MREFDIKSDMPLVSEAQKRVMTLLRDCRGNEKVIKIIHGYGSSGVGGAIKATVHRILQTQKESHQIRAYIPGEAIALLKGFDEDIRRFKPLIQNDADFHKGNDGITYVIF